MATVNEICLLVVSKEILSRGVKVAAQVYRGRGNRVSDLLVARPPWTIKAPCCFGSSPSDTSFFLLSFLRPSIASW